MSALLFLLTLEVLPPQQRQSGSARFETVMWMTSPLGCQAMTLRASSRSSIAWGASA